MNCCHGSTGSRSLLALPSHGKGCLARLRGALWAVDAPALRRPMGPHGKFGDPAKRGTLIPSPRGPRPQAPHAPVLGPCEGGALFLSYPRPAHRHPRPARLSHAAVALGDRSAGPQPAVEMGFCCSLVNHRRWNLGTLWELDVLGVCVWFKRGCRSLRFWHALLLDLNFLWMCDVGSRVGFQMLIC